MSINRKQMMAAIAGTAFVAAGVLGVAAPAQAAPGDTETTVQIPGFCTPGAPIFDQPAGAMIGNCHGPADVTCQTQTQGETWVQMMDLETGTQGFAFKRDVHTSQEPPQC